ncbi:sulfur carrier protein ThiS, partial [Pelagibacteraceae bacterium]|nr:sulfur carrier protein ThiS [Pelagibacteraceae bacterium]
MAKIQLNGKKITIKSKETIYDLLKKLKLNNRKVAIEHNGVIIPKMSYKKKYLKSNDKLEV